MTFDLRLSAADQANVQAAIRTLLVPAPHKSFDQWRLAVHRAVKRVVGGDMVMSYSGGGKFNALLSEEMGRIGEFPARALPLIHRFDTFQRTETLGAWTRSLLWRPHLRAFLRSSYYNEFARPLGALDGVGLAIAAGGIHSGLQVHGDSELGVRFGQREMAILRLFIPAFAVGIELATSYFGTASEGAKLRSDGTGVVPMSRTASGSAQHLPGLTRREMEVAALLAARRSNYEIAEILHMSRATAKRHTENILLKLGLHSRREVERIIIDD